MRTMRIVIGPLALALALSLGLVGCGGDDGEPAEPAATAGEAEGGTEESAGTEQPPEGTVYTVRGIFHGTQYNGRAMETSHEAIPGVMEAMRMAFRVEDPTQIAQLQPGDKIEFVFVYEGPRSFARDVRKLPAETELELAD